MAEPPEADQRILDRELEELLSEIRIVLPGVTVLFAFLLTLPFASGFQAVSRFARGAYFLAFLGAAFAMILLIAQSAYHRLRGKPYNKSLMLRTASRQAIVAIALLALVMAAVVFLVTDVLYPGFVALPLSAAVLVFALVTWFFLPLMRRARRDL